MNGMSTTPPWEWKEDDLLALERQQVPERLDLEYKRAECLQNTDGNKHEISKDVSAMANAAGGIIIYGVAEDKTTGTIRVSGGGDPVVTSTEWLEQVIDSRIQRKIDGIRINPVRLTTVDPGKVAYVVSIPQSTRAPHMASDNRFHKRKGTTTAPMEEYEAHDVARRSESPDLSLHLELLDLPLRLDTAYATSNVRLLVEVSNSSPEPAFYATIRVFVDQRLRLQNIGRFSVERQRVPLPSGPYTVLHRLHSHSDSQPILESERVVAGEVILVRHDSWAADYELRWELRSPKMPTKTGAATLRWGLGNIELITK
jgi:Schlafen, AlbA_2